MYYRAMSGACRDFTCVDCEACSVDENSRFLKMEFCVATFMLPMTKEGYLKKLERVSLVFLPHKLKLEHLYIFIAEYEK